MSNDNRRDECRMPRLAYWNQEEYDQAMHLIHQPRRLQLALEFAASVKPLAKKRVRVYVARSMVEGCDEYHEFLLDANGRLEADQEYGESLLDAELGRDALPAGCGLDTLTFHWFHPGKSFEQLAIRQDVGSWAFRQTGRKAGDVILELAFDPALKPISAYVGFGRLLGHTFEGPKMGSYHECSIVVPRPGLGQISLHMHEFFARWMKNYTTPYTVGNEYPVEVSFIFDAAFPTKPSDRKEAPFVPKSYDGRVDHVNGNPFLDVPSTTPESSIRASALKKLTLTADMLPK
jgi:hypothetical protein